MALTAEAVGGEILVSEGCREAWRPFREMEDPTGESPGGALFRYYTERYTVGVRCSLLYSMGPTVAGDNV